MSFGEYTIKYKSISLPCAPGENEVELSLTRNEKGWVLSRTLGSIYEKESALIEVSQFEVDNLFDKIAKIRVSGLPDSVYGLDGTTHTFRLGSGMNSVTYEWWEDLPEGFESLRPVLEILFRMAGLDVDIREQLFESE